ncbi:MAG: hypothetical protein M3419_03630 [Actinomycetota bacterium]|nr:hypothetical protein [Actinomycetota bacterium]
MFGDQPRRRAWWSSWTVLTLVTVAVVLGWDDRSTPEHVRPEPTAVVASERSERVRTTLATLENAWDTRDRAAFLTAAHPSEPSQVWAQDAFDALVTLDVDEIGLRYVADRDTDDTDAADGAPGEFEADVAVTWQPGRPPDPGYRTASVTVSMRLADRADDVVVLGLAPGALSVGPDGGALPLWLTGELVESGTRQASCLGIETDPQEIVCGRLTQVALGELAAVLPTELRTRTGTLLMVLPATVEQAAAVLGRNPLALTRVAGVSSTVDASGAPDAPQLVVLNPDRFLPLARDERQFVATHESVHVATGAAGVVLPVWVAEGFADYVALRSGRIPPAQAAEQALERVRRVGPPRWLPRDGDFASGRWRLGEAYQQAWSAFWLLGERYGADAVVVFYTAVLDGAPVGRALEDAFGIDRAELTSTWRHALVRQAGRSAATAR